MVWWRDKFVRIKRGQKWRKLHTQHDKEFFAVVIGKGKRDGIKAACSDGKTHNFNRRVLLERYELIE